MQHITEMSTDFAPEFVNCNSMTVSLPQWQLTLPYSIASPLEAACGLGSVVAKQAHFVFCCFALVAFSKLCL